MRRFASAMLSDTNPGEAEAHTLYTDTEELKTKGLARLTEQRVRVTEKFWDSNESSEVSPPLLHVFVVVVVEKNRSIA